MTEANFLLDRAQRIAGRAGYVVKLMGSISPATSHVRMRCCPHQNSVINPHPVVFLETYHGKI